MNMEAAFSVFLVIAESINVIAVAILVFGFTKELFKYLLLEAKDGIFQTPIRDLQKIRCQLGIYILLSLDFMITSDIVSSIVELSFNDLIILATSVAIRIALGYFLAKEINEIHTEDHLAK